MRSPLLGPQRQGLCPELKTNTPSSAQVGDVLYMPRGTIHCATAQQGGPSGHLTISTYQRWSAADLLQYGVSVALANPSLQPLLPAPLKAGLPPGFLAAATLGPAAAAELAAGAGGFGEDGTAAIVAAAAGGGGADGKAVSGSGDVQQLAAQLAAACRALADCLEGRKGGAGLGPRLLTTAADAMAEDFMRHRRGPPWEGRGRGLWVAASTRASWQRSLPSNRSPASLSACLPACHG